MLLTIAVAADFADWLSRKVKTNRTKSHLLLGLYQCLSQGLYLDFGPLENIECQPLSRFWPNAGKFLKLLDQAS